MNILRGFGLMKPDRADRAFSGGRMSGSQRTAAQDIVSRYTPDSMTKDDRVTMHRALRDAGVRPSRELHEMLHRAGLARPPRDQERAAPDPAAGERAHRALVPEPPAPGFVVDFRRKHARGETTPADFGALADTLRTNARSLRGNLIDDVA